MAMTSALMKVAEQLNKGSVLVVEPSDNYRKTIQRYLSNLKIKSIKFCDSFHSARTELAIGKFSLMIIEWQQTGDINGLQFCRDIRKESKLRETPFMLLSTESLRGDVVLASEVGIDGYMVKPFSYEDFCDQLLVLLRKADDRVKYMSMLENAESLYEQRNYEAAERIFIECAQHEKNSARVKCGIARIRLASGLEDEALKVFKEALEVNPTYLEAYRLVLDIYETREQPHHTLHFALQAHQLSPENPRYMLMIAKAYLQIGDLTKSEEFFRKTIRVSPRLAEAHKGLGDIQLMKEDYEKAMNYYRKALDLDGDDVSILNSIGLVYVKLGDHDEGIRQYQLALQVDQKNSKVLFNLGHVYEKTDRLSEALDCYNRALIEEPDYEKAQRGLQRVQKAIAAQKTSA